MQYIISKTILRFDNPSHIELVDLVLTQLSVKNTSYI